MAVLLLASVIDEAILLYVHTGDHNLLWYLGICSAAYAASRSLVPDETKTVNSATREELMDRITACTHYRPKDWIDRAHTTEVRDEMLELFPFKVRLFFHGGYECDIHPGGVVLLSTAMLSINS